MINERKLTENELEKREVALKGLLKNKQSLVKKYGKNAEKVMYGIATKQAKSKVEAMNLDKIKETIGDKLNGMSISYIESDSYNSTNNIYSLWLAREKINEPFLLLESDLVFEEYLLEKMSNGDII